MSHESIIRYYNRLNGNSISLDKLKDFRSRVERHIDSHGSGPNIIDMKGILTRVTTAIKTIIEAGASVVERVELTPIELQEAKAIPAKVEKPKPAKVEVKKVELKKPISVPPKEKKKTRSAIAKRIMKETPPEVREKVKEYAEQVVKKEKGLFGFVTSDKAPATPTNTFTLPGERGKLLGTLQRYKLEIVIAGETHSSKSQLGMQLADDFASMGDQVAWIDWEQGGLQSKDTQAMIERNVKPENRKNIHVSGDVPRTLEAVKSLTKQFKVIALDSGTKLNQVTNAWIDTLREDFPHVVWIIMMQQNEKGGTRGGSAAEFDSPVVLKTYRPDESTHEKNYAYVYKNRGNTTGLTYIINKKKIQEPETKKTNA